MENYKLATTSWRDDNFIRMNGLNMNTALDYFCQNSNPFYEKTSANELSKMNHRRIDSTRFFQEMHYDINLNQSKDPDLYIISIWIKFLFFFLKPSSSLDQKYGKNKILKIYYIIGGTVYQSPSLYDTLSSRLNNSLNLLNTSFKEIKEEYENKIMNGKYYLKNKNEELKEENEKYYPMQYEFDDSINKLLINLQNETKKEIENKFK